MKKVILVLCICLAFVLSSCQFSAHGELFDNEDKMVATGDTYSFLGMLYKNDSISFKRFSGIYTLQSINEDNNFILTIDQDITSGRFKCFLVTHDDEIIELVEGDNMITADGSRMRLRVAGDNAVGKMSFSISHS